MFILYNKDKILRVLRRGIVLKKYIALTICILMVFSLVACGEAESNDADLQQPTEVSQEKNQNEADEALKNEEVEDDIPREYKAALKKADVYANNMHMSKAGVYKQLISEYGEDFPEDAAQYAIENVKADWKENALSKAKVYADEMNMSNSAIYDQLISEHGEQFTEEEAKYAIENLQ